MTIPKAVQEQADKADQLMQAQTAADEGQTVPVVEPDAPEPPAQAGQADAPASEPFNPYAQKDTEPDSDPKAGDANYWRDRFEVMQGKYNSEVPQLAAQVRGLQAQITQMQDQPVQPPQQEEPPKFTDEDFEGYGEEIVFLKQELDTLKAENAQLKGDFGTVQQASVTQAQASFESTMDTLVPDWKLQDEDARFIEFLQQVHPVTGRPLQDSLNEAYAALDGRRCSQIFQLFRDVLAEQSTQGSVPPRSVQPARSVAGGQPPQPPQYTPADLQVLYDEMARGRWAGREDEARQREIEIHAALFTPPK